MYTCIKCMQIIECKLIKQADQHIIVTNKLIIHYISTNFCIMTWTIAIQLQTLHTRGENGESKAGAETLAPWHFRPKRQMTALPDQDPRFHSEWRHYRWEPHAAKSDMWRKTPVEDKKKTCFKCLFSYKDFYVTMAAGNAILPQGSHYQLQWWQSWWSCSYPPGYPSAQKSVGSSCMEYGGGVALTVLWSPEGMNKSRDA